MAELRIEEKVTGKDAVKEMRGRSNGRVVFLDLETTTNSNSDVGRVAVR